MGVKRRAFLIGGAALIGGGIFALQYGDYAARRDGLALTRRDKAGSFTGWLRIGEDGAITLYSPHIDMGTGNATALAQMAADELDADLGPGYHRASPRSRSLRQCLAGRRPDRRFFEGLGGSRRLLPGSIFSALARNVAGQITGGSSAMRFTGQHGFRVLAAAARQALVEEAAARLKVPAGELTHRQRPGKPRQKRQFAALWQSGRRSS